MTKYVNQESSCIDWRTELAQIQSCYQLAMVELQVADRRLELIKVADIDSLLDAVSDVDLLPFWAELWPAAIGLATFILQKNPLFTGKTVLELGSGIGLSGIAAKLAGATVTQSDFIEAAFPFIRINCLRNQVPVGRLLLADWRQFPYGELWVDGIIGSDILYEKTLHPHLHQVLKRMIKPGGTVWLADPGREFGAQFIQELVATGWSMNQMQIPVFYEKRSYDIAIYQLTLQGT